MARLIETGVPPERIVLATFTNKAARTMLSRVKEITGVPTERLWGGTFHHLSHRILRSNAGLLGYPANFSIIDSEDARQMIASCIAASGIDGKADRYKNVRAERRSLTGAPIRDGAYRLRGSSGGEAGAGIWKPAMTVALQGLEKGDFVKPGASSATLVTSRPTGIFCNCSAVNTDVDSTELMSIGFTSAPVTTISVSVDALSSTCEPVPTRTITSRDWPPEPTL